MKPLWKWDLRKTKEYPIINRVLDAFIDTILLCCFFWPVPVIIGGLLIILWNALENDFRVGVITVCSLVFLILWVVNIITNKEKTKN